MIKLLRSAWLDLTPIISTTACHQRNDVERYSRFMVSVFPMLTRQEPYHELGARYFDERRRHYTVDRLAQRIERLGYRVHLEPVATTAA